MASPPPAGLVPSIPEKLLSIDQDEHVAEIHLSRHADVESFALDDGLPPAFRREWSFAARHVYRLRNVMVDIRTGACISDESAYQESYGSLLRWLSARPYPAMGSARGESTDGVCTCVPAAGYYHFLLEELPRLIACLHVYPSATVLVSNQAPSFVFDVIDTLKQTGRLSGRIERLDDGLVQIPDYAFAAAEACSGCVHSHDIESLRQSLLPPELGQSVEGPELLYVSRRAVGSRSPENEHEVEIALAEKGFEVACLERDDLRSQMERLAAARLIVATHGAGLANLVWCRTGARLVEIFSPDFVNDCYARLACQRGIAYQPMWAVPAGKWGRVDIEALLRHLDLRE
ncbi:MAG TPA: glycosyltransferase family 61 protein [Armatimonadota bacterium]|nr:glycosyltransferase family 61 protein [Armatimonadota bacterium]